MEGLSTVGEHGVVWLALGSVCAAVDRRRRQTWVIAALVGPASIVLNYGLKLLVRRSRPERDRGGRGGRTSFSFPSAHATSSFAAATVAGRIESRLWRPALLLAACVSYSRMYLAHHYPTDVVAGGFLGVSFGSAVARRLSTEPGAADES